MTGKREDMASAMRAASDRWSAFATNDALKAAGESFVASVAECQKETADFVTARLEKDRQAMASMMSCKSPTEAMQIQSAWLQETASDYSEAAKRMFELYSNFVARSGAAKKN